MDLDFTSGMRYCIVVYFSVSGFSGVYRRAARTNSNRALLAAPFRASLKLTAFSTLAQNCPISLRRILIRIFNYYEAPLVFRGPL